MVLVPFVMGKTAEEAVEALRSAAADRARRLDRATSQDAWIEAPPVESPPHIREEGGSSSVARRSRVYVNAGATSRALSHERAMVEHVHDSSRQEFEAQDVNFPLASDTDPQPPGKAGVSASVILDTRCWTASEDRLRSGGALIVDALAPGLTDAQIDELLHPAGVDLPEEARVWWRWHDARRRRCAAELVWSGPPAICWTSDTVVEIYEFERAAVAQLHSLDGPLSPVGEKPHIYFDCSRSAR